MNWKIAGYVAIAVAFVALQAQAHHSFSMFDHEKLITVSGTLKDRKTIGSCTIRGSFCDVAIGVLCQIARGASRPGVFMIIDPPRSRVGQFLLGFAS